MNEITKIILENEMDLILAHKQSMRLAELAGLSLSAQTSFATAVSEVSRSAISSGVNTSICLGVSDKKERFKYIIAVLEDKRQNFAAQKDEGYNYAKRIVSDISASSDTRGTRTELKYRLPDTTRIDDQLVEKWQVSLNNDPAVSPYEEIKRKNRQLLEMAEKLRESEQQYKALTDSLPILIYSVDTDGKVIYANQWFKDYIGRDLDEINEDRWKNVLHPDEWQDAWQMWKEYINDPHIIVSTERRLKDRKTGEYKWHKGGSTALTDEMGKVKYRNSFLVDIHAQKMIEQALKDNVELKLIKEELEEKVHLLNQSNQQLEQFAYVASHDLQEPLRKISFYSDFLKERYSKNIPEEAQAFFDNLIQASRRMKVLIQDILAYSTIQKSEMSELDLNAIAAEVLEDLEMSIKEKQAKINISELPAIEGNSRQIKQLFENLVSNSLKFSSPDVIPEINISAQVVGDMAQLSFADNGIGFDTKYMKKMFDLFQRLHSRDKYSGTGIGLAICKKITDLHKGTIEAKGKPGAGATFLITLPTHQ